MREFDYLGHKFQANGKQKAHVKERVKRAASIMGQVWRIGKRRYGRDWGSRIWLFDRLVWTVMGYGAEVWGWKERQEMEMLQKRFLRWVLGADNSTPGYMIREELQREKIRSKTARRAWSFERLEEGRGGELARLYWEEMRKRGERRRDISE